jgi:hypothetical protein
MKIFKKLFLPIAVIAAFVGTSQAMEKPNTYNFEVFSKKHPIEELEKDHSVKPHVKELIDAKLQYTLATGANRFPWLPNHIMKSKPSRLQGSLLIKKCARECNCNLVDTPTKQLYKTSWGDFYIVEKEINFSRQPLSLQQIKQLYKVFKKTDYQDINPGAVLNTQEGIAYIVDTEHDSFIKPLFGNVTLAHKLSVLPMDADAKEWVNKKCGIRTDKYSDYLKDTCAIS